MILVLQSVGLCLSACPWTITFESLDVRSSFSLIPYIFREYGSSSHMKVIGSRSRSRDQKRRNFLFPHRTTSIGNNSALSRDRKWPRVTKCTPSRVVGLRLEGNLVFFINFYFWSRAVDRNCIHLANVYLWTLIWQWRHQGWCHPCGNYGVIYYPIFPKKNSDDLI